MWAPTIPSFGALVTTGLTDVFLSPTASEPTSTGVDESLT